jgi:hypothetical protein
MQRKRSCGAPLPPGQYGCKSLPAKQKVVVTEIAKSATRGGRMRQQRVDVGDHKLRRHRQTENGERAVGGIGQKIRKNATGGEESEAPF